MPGVRAKLMNGTVARSVPVDVEDEKLWLPAQFSDAERNTACLPGLPSKEIELRIAQCNDALSVIRDAERLLRLLALKRKVQTQGQGMKTRAQSTIDAQAARSDFAVDKYRRCRRALERLDPDGSWSVTIRPLRSEDVSNMLGSTFDVDVLLPWGSGTSELSWLWTNESRAGQPEDVIQCESTTVVFHTETDTIIQRPSSSG